MAIKIVAGRDKKIRIFVFEEDGKTPADITGYDYINLAVRSLTGDRVELLAPRSAGADEVQDIDFDSVPDAGSFQITLGNETTAAIPFGASNTDVENAINALELFSEVVVTGNFTGGFQVTFQGKNGKRNQPAVVIANNTLEAASAPVAVTVAVTTEGKSRSGIEVFSVFPAVLDAYYTEEETVLILQDQVLCGDLQIRKGEDDMDIEPLDDFIEVVADPLAC